MVVKWGLELWDQSDNLASHAQRGIEFCEKFSNFIKERQSIEMEYSAKLKKLAKSYKLKRKEDEAEYSWLRAFFGMVNEVHDIAGQHEVIAEGLSSSVIKELQQIIIQLKQDKKKFLQDSAKQSNFYQTQYSQFDKIKKQYERAAREADRALEAYRKADADNYVTKADVEKARLNMIQKEQLCTAAKLEYSAELQKFNHSQRQHYEVDMPAVFGCLEESEMKRIERCGDLVKRCAEVERSIVPIINRCIEGMVSAGQQVQPTEDCKTVVDKYKSGFASPGDLQFEDLGPATVNGVCKVVPGDQAPSGGPEPTQTPKVSRSQSLRSASSPSAKRKTRKFSLFSSKGDDNDDDFSQLPPNQQKKKLVQKINVVKTSLAKETATRDGILKMQDVYRQNPALGDPDSINKQLEESQERLENLRKQLLKVQTFLSEADASRTVSSQDSSWSSKSSSLSSSSLQGSGPSTPVLVPRSNSCNEKEKSLIVTEEKVMEEKETGSVTTDEKENSADNHHDENHFDDGEEETLPVIGTCTAIYTFEAPNDEALSMTGGEVFSVLEVDQGDGWTRVRRQDKGEEEGFVPTSYVQIQLSDKKWQLVEPKKSSD